MESLQSLLSPADLAQVIAHNAQEFPDSLAALLAPYAPHSAQHASAFQVSAAVRRGSRVELMEAESSKSGELCLFVNNADKLTQPRVIS